MIAVLVGTRPELIKIAPILRILKKKKIKHIFIHSNQHYSFEMDKKILQDLNIREPDYNLNIGSSSHATQTGKIMEGVEKICLKHSPKIILVHGDTNTTLGGALAAKKLQIAVAHIEAGLRSFDLRMPEEINRMIVDRISDILFAPTVLAKKNLIREGISRKNIMVTGNTVVDALYEHISLSEKSTILERLNIQPSNYILATAHRAENVDSSKQLKKIVALLEHATQKLGKKIIYPIHPRTQQKIEEFGITLSQNIIVIKPVGYIDMLQLQTHASLILTDSGGIQEEAFILKKPLMTLRDSTERPETLTANFIIHNSKTKFNEAWKAYQNGDASWNDSFGTGTTSSTIVDRLLKVI